MRHLPDARANAPIRPSLRAGVSQTSGEETAASVALVVEAYGAMAIWRRRLWQAGSAVVPNDAGDIGNGAHRRLFCPIRMPRRGASSAPQAELAMRLRTGRSRCAIDVEW